MHYCSTVQEQQDYGMTGILYDVGSVYERLIKLTDLRKAKGKLYVLELVLLIVIMAKVGGKVRHGMRQKDEEGQEYGLSIYDVEQAKVGCKENEIVKALQALQLVEISQKVITSDAMHTQRGLATQILDAQGEYVLSVKENQPQLYINIQSLFAPEYPEAGFRKIQTDFLTAQKINKGHGRIEIRTITTSEILNAYAAWPGLAQVYRLERQFYWRRNGRCYRTSGEVEFGITSLPRKEISPQQWLHLRRTHWGIETGLNYRRDVTLNEDATRMTIGNTGKIMASINNLVLALIRQAGFHNAAQARRWFAADLSKAFALLTTPSSPS